MPTYNSLWLKEAIDSVLTQSYPNFELVVVNDASTIPRRSMSWPTRNATPRSRSLTTPAISALPAPQRGIEASQADYIAFMDSDDLLHPDALALFVRT